MQTESNILAFPESEPSKPLDIASLFDEHGAYLVRAMTRLTGSREVAEDVVQEVFILAHRRREELVDRKGIRTWLYRAAVNHVRHKRRSVARFLGFLDRYKVRPMAESVTPDVDLERVQSGQRIADVVAKLSDKQREVFVLFELEEMEGAEIAEILGISVNTVWSRLRLARAAFREHWTQAHGEER